MWTNCMGPEKLLKPLSLNGCHHPLWAQTYLGWTDCKALLDIKLCWGSGLHDADQIFNCKGLLCL